MSLIIFPFSRRTSPPGLQHSSQGILMMSSTSQSSEGAMSMCAGLELLDRVMWNFTLRVQRFFLVVFVVTWSVLPITHSWAHTNSSRMLLLLWSWIGRRRSWGLAIFISDVKEFSYLGETVSLMLTLEMMEGVGLEGVKGEEEAEGVVHGGVETQLQDCSDKPWCLWCGYGLEILICLTWNNPWFGL